ncbi:MAG: FAD-binding oxidoreductase [Burkholderiaceae bacterium]
MSEAVHVDVIVIGAGIAGASAAAELAASFTVLLLEAEEQPGYHSTGRSAAVYLPTYGPAPIRSLTRASGGFLGAPPAGFTEVPLLCAREVLFIAREDQLAHLDDHFAEHAAERAPIARIDGDEVMRRLPLLRSGYAAAGLSDTSGSDIDVAALHQGYLRLMRQRGGRLLTRARVDSLEHAAGRWLAHTEAGLFSAPVVVNAAGAWAEQVGQMAGAEVIGLVPKRRTALIVAAPDGMRTDTLPMAVDIDESFYMKPDAGRLLISPANEDPQAPADAQADEMDIAICIDRVQRAFDLDIRRIENKWAGLRCFVADKSPVIGFSERVPGFFWLAGQGGYGVQSSPAVARLVASLIGGRPMPDDIREQGLDPASISPGRFAV